MPSRHRTGRTLEQSLDREVHQVVRKIIDEQEQFEPSPTVSFVHIYDSIKASNSSLNRKPKRLLEDSIQRVLDAIQRIPHGDSESGDSELVPNPAPDSSRPASTNGLNRSIVGAWSQTINHGTMPPTHDSGEGRKPKSTRAERDREENGTRQLNGEPLQKRRKAGHPNVADHAPPTHVSLDDLGGIDPILEQFEKLLALPMSMPGTYMSMNIRPPRGVLIHGPPGCGKTMIANAFAAELAVNFISVSAPSIVSGMSGESEKALRELFDEARKSAPCLVFIDEIDAITPKRESAQRDMEKRIVAQLCTCMDDLDIHKTDGKPVIVLAATTRPDSLDPALRRGGRFDKEIHMSVPSEEAREKILKKHVRGMALAPDVDISVLARRTPGYVGADLQDLVSSATSAALHRYHQILRKKSLAMGASMEVDGADVSSITPLEQTKMLLQYLRSTPVDKLLNLQSPDTTEHPPDDLVGAHITHEDFLTALRHMQPTALREGFATVPSTTFAQIGALSSHIAALNTSIILPILNPKLYNDFGINPESGTLLWGPPGCGKTLLAKAVANSSHANFISVKGPELLNKYVGESERAVRQLFNRARSSVPVIIFFDELDALAPRRDSAMSEASSRVVNMLLAELDGFGSSREGIYVIAATNRPDMIDPAMLRHGRLETQLFIGLPDSDGRVEILRTLSKGVKGLEWSSEIETMARECEQFSGADLDDLLARAVHVAIARTRASIAATGTAPPASVITIADFEAARREVKPSVTKEDMERYAQLRKKFGGQGG